MIARLRRRHRRWIAVLFVATATLFGWALVARKQVPVVTVAPGAVDAPP